MRAANGGRSYLQCLKPFPIGCLAASGHLQLMTGNRLTERGNTCHLRRYIQCSTVLCIQGHYCNEHISSVTFRHLVARVWTLGRCVNSNLYYVEIKCQLDATEVFIADLIAGAN